MIKRKLSLYAKLNSIMFLVIFSFGLHKLMTAKGYVIEFSSVFHLISGLK